MKNYKAIFTARAERQLSGLYAYIAEKSGEARAEKYVGGIIATVRRFRSSPSAAQNAMTSAKIYGSKVMR